MQQSKTQVILVNDDQTQLIFIKALLGSLGIEVGGYTDPEQALSALLSSTSCSLLITDLNLGAKSGLNLLENIRQLAHPLNKLPVLVISVSPLAKDLMSRCKQLDSEVLAPYSPESLRSKVCSMLAISTPTVPDPNSKDEIIQHDRWDKIKSVGGKKLLHKTVTIFMKKAPKQLVQMKESVSHNDYQRLERLLHSLHGSAAMLGAHRLASLCRDLEQKAQAKVKMDFTCALTDLEKELQAVIEHIRQSNNFQ